MESKKEEHKKGAEAPNECKALAFSEPAKVLVVPERHKDGTLHFHVIEVKQ